MIDIKEKPKMVERAFLVGVDQPGSEDDAEALLEELAELVSNMGVAVVEKRIVRLREPQPRYFTGSGKAEELAHAVKESECDCLVFDVPLSPAQQRNWETLTGVCVIDRQEVILDIFADRAQTREAVLQVELARAEYSLPRLKNAWTHLSRQRGGGVTQRGEGEAQIELDARIVRQRIAKLKEELTVVVKQREVQRKKRLRVPLPSAAIVGYTNAGKSSLLNALTGASVLAEDKLFATLDPTTRQLTLKGGQKILLTDTVGFVRRLPHRLVEAFKATLEEAVVADFLIHVLDATSPDLAEHRRTTLDVLRELGADEKRIITVYNKADLLERNGRRTEHPFDENGIFVSAHTGEGLHELTDLIEQMLEKTRKLQELIIPHERYDVVGKLHAAGCVKHENALDDGVHLICSLPPRFEALALEFAASPSK